MNCRLKKKRVKAVEIASGECCQKDLDDLLAISRKAMHLTDTYSVCGDARHLERSAANAVHAADLELAQHHASSINQLSGDLGLVKHHARPCATEQRVVSASRDQALGHHRDAPTQGQRTGSTAAHWRLASDATAARRRGGAGRWRAGRKEHGTSAHRRSEVVDLFGVV